MDCGWKIHNDLWGSDHFPIILESLQPLHEYRLPQWKINKANWLVFETMCKQELLKDPNIIDQTKHFTETLISIANETIAKTSASNKHSTPWFNDDCITAIRQRKAALRKFNKEPTTNNLNAFKLLWAKTRKPQRNTRRKVGKTMSTNLVPLPEQTLSVRWWGKYPEKANQLLSNTSQKTNRKQLPRKT